MLALAGDWHLERGLISGAALERELAHPPMPRRIAFDAAKLGQWDSSLVAFVAEVLELCHTRDLAVDPEGLPGGLRRLVELAEAVPEAKDAYSTPARAPLVERVGAATIAYTYSIRGFVAFLGAVTIALGRFMVGRARYRRVDLMVAIQDCGARRRQSYAHQFPGRHYPRLRRRGPAREFGAQSSSPTWSGSRRRASMGAMMTAIIMAGRTGAGFAAQLGTMKVNQEIDAF